MEYALIDGQRVGLTEWFPAEVKPVHVGVYETGSGLIPWYRYFDGTYWHTGGVDPDDALDRYERHNVSIAATTWRGLSHPPGAT